MFNEYEIRTFLFATEEERYHLSQHPIIMLSLLVPKWVFRNESNMQRLTISMDDELE